MKNSSLGENTGAGFATESYRRKITLGFDGQKIDGMAKEDVFCFPPQIGVDYRTPTTKLSLYIK